MLFESACCLVAGSFLISYPLKVDGTTAISRGILTYVVLVSLAGSIVEPWSILFSLLLSVLLIGNYFFPMILVVGCVGLSGGLVLNYLLSLLDYNHAWWLSFFGGAGCSLGALTSRSLLLNWQVYAVPVLGGFLLSKGSEFPVWLISATLGVYLQVRKLRIMAEALKLEEAAITESHYKLYDNLESQSSTAPGSPNNSHAAILRACQGDKDQIDRVLFGGGLW